MAKGKLWEKFGEQNSAEDINALAKQLLNSGKRSDVYALAEENGIDKDMAELFVNEEIDFICDKSTAASGKLMVEIKHYQKTYVANALEVVEVLQSMMVKERIKLSVHKYGVDIDITGEDLADAVRHKGKVLNDILKDVFTRAQKIHSEGNPASALVVPMVIQEYLKPVKEGKKCTKSH